MEQLKLNKKDVETFTELANRGAIVMHDEIRDSWYVALGTTQYSLSERFVERLKEKNVIGERIS